MPENRAPLPSPALFDPTVYAPAPDTHFVIHDAVYQHLARRNALGYTLKRGLDLLAAMTVCVLLLWWLLPLLALLIWLADGHNPFFVQHRVGRNNKLFPCLKLRSMRPGDEPSEQRTTPLGHHLRLYKLDELPQFLNVLSGHMSLVGPRPHMISDHHRFGELVGERHYNNRHAVLPGITGLAQVSGYEGPVKDPAMIQGRVRYDLHYIRNWSLRMELYVIWRTAVMLLGGLFGKK